MKTRITDINNLPTELNDRVMDGAVTGGELTMATNRLLGRTTAGTGAIEEISVGAGLSLSGGTIVASGTTASIHSVKVSSTSDFANTAPTATVLTASAVGVTTFDGVALVLNDRVLLKNQTNSQENGIYVVSTEGTASVATVLTRASDMDSWGEVPGAFVFIKEGTSLADTGWLSISNDGGTLGTTAINWVQFSGTGAVSFQSLSDAADYVAGDANKVVKVNSGGTGLDFGAVLGTAASQNTGTSGANIPLLNAANTWSSIQAFQLAADGANANVISVENTGTASATAATISLRSGGSERGFLRSRFDGTVYKMHYGAGTAHSFENTSGTLYATINSNGLSLEGSGKRLLCTAATTSQASLRIPHGTAPTSPINGDIWTTTSGLHSRVNGDTVDLSLASWNKRIAAYATTADLGSSTSTANTITGFDDTGTVTGDLTASSTTVSNVSAADIAKLKVGAGVTGTNIPASTTITQLSTSAFVISNAATAAGTATVITYTQTIAALSVDGATPSTGTRILVKNETSAARNGIYAVTATGSTTEPWVLTRATDADTSAKLASAEVVVDLGTVNTGTAWHTNFPSTGTIGTTAVKWLPPSSNRANGKETVLVATTQNLPLSGTVQISIDGVTPVAGDRILLKDQTTTAQNGIYDVIKNDFLEWTISRSSDADAWDELANAYVFVEKGTVNKDKLFFCSSDRGGTLGTTAVTWVEGGVSTFQGLTDAANYVAGDANKVVKINSGGTGLDFGAVLGDAAAKNTGTAAGTVAAGDHTHTFQALTDATDYVAGDANKVVKVNSGGTGLDYGAVLGTAASANSTDFATAAHVHSAFGGANGTVGGSVGFVPAPAATDNVKFLRGDGTWAAAAGGVVAFNSVFTGDGTTTAFTMAESVTAAGDILVTINGVMQLPTTHYTVSGTTLTFATAPANGANLMARRVGGSTGATGPTPVIGVEIALSMIGKPIASQKLARYVATRAATFDQSLCRGSAAVAATASTVFEVKKNGTAIGSFTFAASATVATISVTDTALAAGDVITFTAPATPDSTLEDIALTLAGSR